MKTYEEKGRLVISLEGRIDSSNSKETEAEIKRILEENAGKEFLLDAGDLEHISSAGLRVLLELHKNSGTGITIRNVSMEIYEILDVTGFTTFMKVKKKPRTVSVEGCPVIGKGAVGEVYRLDVDTIVKVYENEDYLPMIENEQVRARQAFLKGIPTAIPFDIVKVGDRYGSVFEMIKAKNCSELLAEDTGRLEEMIGMYAGFLRQVHGAVSEPGELPDARELYLGYLDTAAEVIPEEVCSRIRTLIREMPEDLHVIHGDIQLKNVMYSNGEMILIDMETLSCGNPVFDLAGMYMSYIAFCEDEPENSMNFMGLPLEVTNRLCYGTLRRYLAPADEAAWQTALDKIVLLAYVRFLFVLSLLGGGNPDCHERRIKHSREHLEELAGRVRELAI